MRRHGGDWAGQSGGIISNWLLQLTIFLLVLGFVGYEAIATAVAAVSVQDTAREVAVSGAEGYRGGGMQLSAARTAASRAAAERDVELLDVAVRSDVLVVTVQNQARTLLIHKIGPLRGATVRTATSQVRWHG